MDIRDGILTITDGTERITFLDDRSGLKLIDWKPKTNEFKQGGVWQDSPLVEGQRLAMAVYDSVSEIIDFTIEGFSQSQVIQFGRALRQMLHKASLYWTEPANQTPVWLEFRARDESTTGYAILLAGKVVRDDAPFGSGFTHSMHGHASMFNLQMAFIRDTWRDNPPGEADCVQTYNDYEYEAIRDLEEAEILDFAISAGLPYNPGRVMKDSNGYLYIVAGSGNVYTDFTGVGNFFALSGPVGGGFANEHVLEIVETAGGALLASYHNTVTNVAAIYRSINFGIAWNLQHSITLGARLRAPRIILALDGTLFAAFNDPDGASVIIYKSSDDGVTWTGHHVVENAGLQIDMVSPAATLSDGRLLFLAFRGTRLITIISDDDGDTWDVYDNSTFAITNVCTDITQNGGVLLLHELTAAPLSYPIFSLDRGESWDWSDEPLADYNAALLTEENAFLILEHDDPGVVWTMFGGDPEPNAPISINVAAGDRAVGLVHRGGNVFIAVTENPGANRCRVFTITKDVLSTTIGRTSTCEDEVFVANQHPPYNITHILLYDSSAGTYTEIHPIAAFPQTILPNPLGVNDAILFACPRTDDIDARFSSIVFDLAQGLQATGNTVAVWEHYTTAPGWATLDVVDWTSSLRNDGVHSVHWQLSTITNDIAINGITAYWVRLRFTAVNGVTALPQQQNRDIYTCTTPYFDIDDSVDGDLDALGRALVKNVSSYGGPRVGDPTIYTNRLILGKRSLSRGTSFTPWLMATNILGHPEIRCFVGEDSSLMGGNNSPDGVSLRVWNVATTNVLEPRCKWVISSAASSQYYGEYHAFLIVDYQSVGDPGDFTARLRIISGRGGIETVTQSVVLDAPGRIFRSVYDMGAVSISAPQILSSSEEADNITVILEVSSSDAASMIFIDAVVLMPVDEWAGDFVDIADTDASVVGGRTVYDIDSIFSPKSSLRCLVKSIGGYIKSVYETIKNGPFSLSISDTQRIWALAMKTFSDVGTHTGANNAAMLTDSNADFDDTGIETGMLIYNVTDGSRGVITAFTATTITATLEGGAENDWDTGDEYYTTSTGRYVAEFEAVHRVKANKVQRYFSMRGE